MASTAPEKRAKEAQPIVIRLDNYLKHSNVCSPPIYLINW